MQLEHKELFPYDCPTIYFNGFSIGLGTGDVVIALQLNGKTSFVLNASYTVAKTFSESLTKVIEELEQKTTQNIMTVQKVSEALLKDNGSES